MEVDELLRTGRLRSSNHGQQPAVRDDKVGFFSLTGADDDEGFECSDMMREREDRGQLMNMSEIDHEQILSRRYEERQRQIPICIMHTTTA